MDSIAQCRGGAAWVIWSSMRVSPNDRKILRELGRRQAEIAALPIQQQTAGLWRRLNRLEKVRPLVWINEIPWHEINVGDELTLRCKDPFLRKVEGNIRMTLYQWAHMRADMVVGDTLYCQYVCAPTSSYADYGIQAEYVIPEGTGSRQFIPVIHGKADVDKMRAPPVTVDWGETERRYNLMRDVFDGILPVVKRGLVHQWCSPWDQMIHWYGIEQLFLDMLDNPGLVHHLLTRFMACIHEVLDKQEAMGLLSVSDGNHRVGSGGLGITDQLPPPDFDPARVRPKDQWGTSTGQIFSEVSPEMHEEFCLQYERPYLARFGLTCYGCCEPLHNKIHLLRTIPNLRRISMSTWIDVKKAAAAVGAGYIFSYKPNPAFLAMSAWDPAVVRADLRRVLELTRPCRVELILKDISTVCNDPRRIWEWSEIAMEMAAEYA